MLSDRKLLLGIGMGILIGTFFMLGAKVNYSLSNSQIEEKAAALGMKYPDEIKVINQKGVSK
ncbi:MAG: hypothetical protein K0R54_4636 [Clostridiaceae bacterium]|nr:hypothetical protein [Clostridiaceae bacterium]